MTCTWKDGKLVFGIHSWDLSDVLLPDCLMTYMDEAYLDKHDWGIEWPWPDEPSGRRLAAALHGWNFEVEFKGEEVRNGETYDKPNPTLAQTEMLLRLSDVLLTKDINTLDELVTWAESM